MSQLDRNPEPLPCAHPSPFAARPGAVELTARGWQLRAAQQLAPVRGGPRPHSRHGRAAARRVARHRATGQHAPDLRLRRVFRAGRPEGATARRPAQGPRALAPRDRRRRSEHSPQGFCAFAVCAQAVLVFIVRCARSCWIRTAGCRVSRATWPSSGRGATARRTMPPTRSSRRRRVCWPRPRRRASESPCLVHADSLCQMHLDLFRVKSLQERITSASRGPWPARPSCS